MCNGAWNESQMNGNAQMRIENEEQEWMRCDKDLPHSSLRLLLLSHFRVNVHFSLFHCSLVHTHNHWLRAVLESHLICLPLCSLSLCMVNSTAIFSTRVTSKKWLLLLNWKRKENVKRKKSKKSLADCINFIVIKSASGFSFRHSGQRVKNEKLIAVPRHYRINWGCFCARANERTPKKKDLKA